MWWRWRVTDTVHLVKRVLVGNPMRSDQLSDTLLPKRLALPVYCSDPISSNAYATQEILLVLALGGTALLTLTPWIAAAVIALLLLVSVSYLQTCYAYASGGGAYVVSKENLGRWPSLIAAASLMVDYVMTVAVSVASSVENLTSAFAALRPYSVLLCLGIIALLTVMNLRGVRESGMLFAIPTYGFIASIYVMLIVGLWKVVTGSAPVAESAAFNLHPGHLTTAALVILVLRAFASGCTSLTGVEAVSNGVPTFRKPKSRNAGITLIVMALLSTGMMLGIAVLSTVSHVRVAEDTSLLDGAPAGYVQRTVLAQLSSSIFGNHTLGFFLVQVFTALILAMAANTAYNGFPILASILAKDRFLPKQLARRGDRLVYSNGILILAGIASGLIWLFDASTTRLIQLYIVGVFISFTLSQTGMVVHWRRIRRQPGAPHHTFASLFLNSVGASATALVLVIVLVSKFTHGAWMVVVAIPILVFLMHAISRHYMRTSESLRPKAVGYPLPSRVHVIVLVSQLNEPCLKALSFARAMRPSSLVAVHVDTHHDRTLQLCTDWVDRDIPVTLKLLDSRYRDLTTPILAYLRQMRIGPRDIVEVIVPEYVVGHWWEQVLHNQSALRLKTRLLYMPGVMVTSVPYQLSSAVPYRLERPGRGVVGDPDLAPGALRVRDAVDVRAELAPDTEPDREPEREPVG